MDGIVQVAPDSTGKKLDTSELTRVDGTIIERQRGTISDPIFLDAHAGVGIDGSLRVESKSAIELLAEILTELKTITFFLGVGMNVNDDPKSVRREMVRERL